jgi:hypothetical protein
MPTITVIDESTMGMQQSWDLEFLEESLSLSEIIKQRIYQEVTEYNAKRPETFRGLVQPEGIEQLLNGNKNHTARHKKIAWQSQYVKALEAFERHGFIVLVDNKQINDLTTTLTLHAGSTVTFFKLVPLVGG